MSINEDTTMLEHILSKIHIRSIAVLIAALFSITGIVMIYHGIQDEGTIDLSSAVVSGKLKTGLVGVTMVFIGAIITLTCIFIRPVRQKIKIQTDFGFIEWEGTVNSIQNLISQMEIMVDQINKKKT